MPNTAVSTPAGLKNILVATDYSPVSSRAIGFAASLSSRFGARLYALHAGGPVNYAVPAQLWKEAEEASRVAAVELGKTLHRDFPGLESEILASEGPAWSAINNAVTEKQIELVVLGTHGRTGLAKFLLGSVAEEILRRAACPVLCVGPNAQTWDENSLAGGRILYATDFSPEGYHAARQAFSWASEWKAHLTLLHVLEDGANLNFGRPLEPADAAKRLMERLLPENAESHFSYEVLVERGTPGEQIPEAAERLGAALIVMGAREPAGLPGAATHLPASTLHKVIARAPCAVLSAH